MFCPITPIKQAFANSVDPYQTLQNVVSDKGLHCSHQDAQNVASDLGLHCLHQIAKLLKKTVIQPLVLGLDSYKLNLKESTRY